MSTSSSSGPARRCRRPGRRARRGVPLRRLAVASVACAPRVRDRQVTVAIPAESASAGAPRSTAQASLGGRRRRVVPLSLSSDDSLPRSSVEDSEAGGLRRCRCASVAPVSAQRHSDVASASLDCHPSSDSGRGSWSKVVLLELASWRDEFRYRVRFGTPGAQPTPACTVRGRQRNANRRKPLRGESSFVVSASRCDGPAPSLYAARVSLSDVGPRAWRGRGAPSGVVAQLAGQRPAGPDGLERGGHARRVAWLDDDAGTADCLGQCPGLRRDDGHAHGECLEDGMAVASVSAG